MRLAGLIVAAGRSERFGRDKLWLPFRGGPLWMASYRTLRGSPSLDGVGLVVPPGREGEFKRLAADALFIVAGGETRQESVRIGVGRIPEPYDGTLVHDAARPWVSVALVEAVADAVRAHGAAYPAVPVTDTVRLLPTDGPARTLDRSRLIAAQTPQGARLDWLRESLRRADGEATDEVSLLEAVGHRAVPVPGEPANLKVTHPADLWRILGPVETRTGLGYDVHAFSADPARPMWLGGVEFDDRPGLDGHSDADALLHAVVDALLGAAGLGDIGVHFPDSDPRWAGRRSVDFLAAAARAVAAEGWSVVHIDASVLAERPRVMPRSAEIRAVMAGTLGIDATRVSVKATTNEGLGAIGRGEGVACLAVATIVRSVEK